MSRQILEKLLDTEHMTNILSDTSHKHTSLLSPLAKKCWHIVHYILDDLFVDVLDSVESGRP